MKKLLLIPAFCMLFACEAEQAPDCNCNRVTQVNIGINDPWWFYNTKNECTGKVVTHECTPDNHPNVGDCK